MKNIWFEIVRLGYINNLSKFWEDRHVRVTVGENKIMSIYYLFNKEPDKEIEKGECYTEFKYEEKIDFENIILGESMLIAIAGKFEVIKSENKDEFKIEFL